MAYPGAPGRGAPAPFDPDVEVELWESNTERQRWQSLGDLYVAMKTTEHLDSAFLSHSLSSEDYTEQCYRLIAQYKTIANTLAGGDESKQKEYGERFMREWGLGHCQRARTRLMTEGVPITSLHSGGESRGESVHVAETVSRFITAMDALKLDMKAVDDIQPLCNDLVSSLNRHPREARDSATPAVKAAVASLNEQRDALSRWLLQLNSMSANEELTDEQVRQLSHDLERAYAAFHSSLS